MELRYVSPVKGHLVTRFGTGAPLGASVSRDPKTGESTVVWDEAAVVAIPEDEWNRHIKEYTRLVTHGALIERDKKAHDECLAREKKAAEADASRVQAEAAKAEAAAKKAEPDGEKPKPGKKE